MILRPIAPAAPTSAKVQPAWPVIEQTQKDCAAPCWIIAQPDHAALAGEIAAGIGPPLLEALDYESIQGIALHDEGWAPFDTPMPKNSRELLSFFDVSAEVALTAWRGSIERAEAAGPMAGAIVSRHFWRIGSTRIAQGKDAPSEIDLLNRFIADEQARQRGLVSGRSAEMEALTDVLQFCDVVSLYICCGATEDVSFPQQFHGRSLSLRRVRGGVAANTAVCRFDPSPFSQSMDLAIPARRFPDGTMEQVALVLY
jgi:hypothetical protein